MKLETNSRDVEETISLPEEKEKKFKRIKKSIIKWNTRKYLNY